jgi:hypothetical protein
VTKSINTNYPFAVWIRSILFASLILIIVFIFDLGTSAPIGTFLAVIFAIVFVGLSFSWLIFLVFDLCFRHLIYSKLSPKTIKVILCCMSIVLMLSICTLFGIDLFTFDIYISIPAAYFTGIIVATLISKIQISTSPEEE